VYAIEGEALLAGGAMQQNSQNYDLTRHLDMRQEYSHSSTPQLIVPNQWIQGAYSPIKDNINLHDSPY